jgi:acyl-coenzyme A synthetase/AMP-(fatty) acid ligase
VDAAVFDDDGQSVVGAIGELVARNTFPGMTHAFFRDPERYLDTYWSRWNGVWMHGDLASVDEHGMWRIHGRSDDTIKLSGRRVGPAEIDAALLRDPRIAEVAVIGVPDELRGQRASRSRSSGPTESSSLTCRQQLRPMRESRSRPRCMPCLRYRRPRTARSCAAPSGRGSSAPLSATCRRSIRPRRAKTSPRTRARSRRK